MTANPEKKDPIITVSNLTKKFGKFTAVDNVNFNIHKGEILGFIGPNGAGKTTTIKMINGLLSITSGEVWVQGKDIKKNLRQVKGIMGYMSQKFSLYPLLTAMENVEFFAGITGISRYGIEQLKEKLRNRIDPVFLDKLVNDVPPGVKQDVALFVSLISDPEIIFLDEPTSGVAPDARRSFWMEIYNLKKMGKTLLVSTHNLDEVAYVDRILMIHHGKKLVEGAPDDLLKTYQKESIEILFKDLITENEQT